MKHASRSVTIFRLLALAGAGTFALPALAQAPATASQPEAGVASSPAAPARARLAQLRIKGALAEREPGLAFLFGGDRATLRAVVEAIEGVAKDDAVRGLVIRLDNATLTPTQVEEMGVAIRAVRDAGKRVHVVSDTMDAAQFMLAGYADEAIAQSGAPASLPGLYMEEMFLADTMSWVGLRADMVQVGAYKGASEMMMRNAPSPEWEQNISGLLDAMYANVRRPILAGRKLDDAGLDRAMGRMWLADSEDAKAVGLIDSVIDLPTLSKHMEATYAAPITWRRDLLAREDELSVDPSNPLAALAQLSARFQAMEEPPSGPSIAVLHLDGAIADGDSTSGFFGGGNVGGDTIRNAVEQILKNDSIRGVVVRINSPGGSATASEVMWQGVRRLVDGGKPVYVSVGDMAASGGYYVAVAGQRIYVNPSSVVGSIGVVGGKISMEGLYEKARIGVTGRARGPRADLFASNKAWTDEQRELVRERMRETYDQFVTRVRAGRPSVDMNQIGEGRLFTGDRAVALGMADEVGGLSEAIADLAQAQGLSDFNVLDYPAPKGLREMLQDMMGGGSLPSVHAGIAGTMGGAMASAPGQGLAPALGIFREVLGDRAFAQLEPSIHAMLQLRDQRVLLISPRAIIWR